ncbi:MarR family winged helix-turn-helix transcriptional regulator [Streptomyces noursei]|uniref:MarR family winged helix-turn-helix transcriptional regulator n=1 Tax=Streptomyces noursei TaxID=1971 RepID=UPI0016760E05|nr:MarR family transcriptional regulator [Streptomyces noursei]MCZ1018833.1 MarR family transcriptional regulator [Streptomyces noursei]GGX22007.1 MarR family transcriptional regulator [Streptomyces noursei]
MPDKDQERLAADLGATVSLLMRRLRAASPQGELTPTQRAVLARVDADGPATIAGLARAELVRPQSMRMIVGVLEERGILARSPHPTDGRRVVFSLTDEGHRVLRDVRAAKNNWLAVALADRLTADEQRTLAEATALIRRLTGE